MNIENVEGAFTDENKTVIGWEGKNYYQSCDEPVVQNEDGSGTHCVKRIDHPGDIHEDFDGVRKTEDQGRIVIVVSFVPIADDKSGHALMQGILRDMKPLFKDKEDVKVMAAVRDKADQVLMILNGDG